MRYRALATDYDGTLAAAGRVDERTIAALEGLRATGRRLVLVTGRIRADLEAVFSRADLFDLVVAENGATLWRPGGAERSLAHRPPAHLVGLLRSRGVPVDVGAVVVATREPHDAAALQAIRELGLDLQLVFNKGAVMVLPPGVTKASGLERAVAELGLTRHEVVAIGDAENDIAMLRAAECGVAVDNALPAVKAIADLVTRGARGEGVVELARALALDDLAGVDPPRHHVPLGAGVDGPVALPPAGTRVVVAGATAVRGALVARVAGRLAARGYQVCLLDPGGAVAGLDGFAPIGSARRAPGADEIAALVEGTRGGVAASLAAVPERDRPALLARLWAALRALRARTARPHWLAVDEAHRALPRRGALALDGGGLLLATSRPERLSAAALEGVQAAIAAGEGAPAMLGALAAALGIPAPAAPRPRDGEALLWRIGGGVGAFRPGPGAPPPIAPGVGAP